VIEFDLLFDMLSFEWVQMRFDSWRRWGRYLVAFWSLRVHLLRVFFVLWAEKGGEAGFKIKVRMMIREARASR